MCVVYILLAYLVIGVIQTLAIDAYAIRVEGDKSMFRNSEDGFFFIFIWPLITLVGIIEGAQWIMKEVFAPYWEELVNNFEELFKKDDK